MRILQAVLVAVLVVQGVRLAWMLVPPAPVGKASAAAASAPVAGPQAGTGFDPFFPASALAASADDSGISLHGIAGGPGGASAILGRPDGRQASFRVGEEVHAGVRLVAIQADQVVLETASGRRQLGFITGGDAATGTRPGATSLPSGAPASGAPVAIDAASLLEQAGLSPRQVDGSVAGYTLIPRGDGAVLRQAGLQAGDVVLSINGQPLTPESYQELASQLQGQSSLELSIQRDGATRTVQVPLQ